MLLAEYGSSHESATFLAHGPALAMKTFFSRIIQVPAWQLAFCILLPALLSVTLYQTNQGRLTHVNDIPSPPRQTDGLVWHVSHVRLDAQNNRYEIAGWVADRKDKGWLKPRVVLVQQDQMNGVEIRTKMVMRPDVAAYMGDGRAEHFGGFQAFLRTKDMPHAVGARIYLSVEREGQRVLVDTGVTLPGAVHG